MPTEAPPAPPVAALAPASAPAPVTPAHAGKAPTPAKDLNDAFAQLDAMGEPDQGEGASAPPIKPEAQPTTPKPGEKPAEPAPGEPPKPVKAQTLRDKADRAEARVKELEGKIAALETEKGKPSEDLTKLNETLAQREQRLKELEEVLKFTDYQQSTEYKDKYVAPFVEAYEEGSSRVASMKVMGPDGNERPGTAEDWDAIMRITNDEQAAAAIEELFGTGVKSQMVTDARMRTKATNRARLKAIEDYRKQGGEREQQRTEQGKQLMAKITKDAETFWQKHLTGPYDKHPAYFKPIEGDDKANELLADGFKEVSEAFKNLNAFDPRLTPEQRENVIKQHATVYNKAAAFNRLAYLLAKEKKLRVEAETKLKEFEKSEPGRGDGKGGANVALSTWDQVDADLAKLAR